MVWILFIARGAMRKGNSFHLQWIFPQNQSQSHSDINLTINIHHMFTIHGHMLLRVQTNAEQPNAREISKWKNLSESKKIHKMDSL